MGQAKRRGTFEERREAAILREEEAELERHSRNGSSVHSKPSKGLLALALASAILPQPR